MVDIFTYLDYRRFLHDLYAERKAKSKYFSYRYLAQKTGLKSVGFFTWVLQGKRNLSSRLVLKFAEAFKLNKQETAYFELLVSYNQAKSHEEKKHYFDRIASLKKRPSAKVVDTDQYEFYEKWYYSAIREMIGIQPFKDDYARMAKSMTPAITTTEARKAVELLEKLGFIVKNEDGLFVRKDSTITSGESWKSLAIAHYQMQTLDLAKQSMDRFPKTERDVSTLTLSCSLETFTAIREKLKGLRQELAEMVKNDPSPECVYQCNLQVFPLCKPMREKSGEENGG